MKQILAVIKPFLAQRVLDQLPAEKIDAVQVREVKGYGRQKTYLDEYGESEFAEAFLPKVEIALWVSDEDAGEVVDCLAATARTGRIGDGKIMVMPVESATSATMD